MRSDVPFGAFLSGGLDSASVVAAMSAQRTDAVKTFTIGFSEREFDERDLARDAAERFLTHNHEEIAAPEMFDDSLEKALAHFDEPFGDASAVPVGLVSGLARKHVTMVLTGDGGDEVLSGYTSYVGEKLTKRYVFLPAAIRRVMYHGTSAMAALAGSSLRHKLQRAGRFMKLADASFGERVLTKMSKIGPEFIRRLVPGSVSQIRVEDYFAGTIGKCRFRDPFYQLMYFNLKVSLPDDMLAKVDRMSMAHSLETRVPFLDHRLVELTYQVHKDVKMPGLRRKDLLRRTIGRLLPPSLLKAPKRGFSVPMGEWFKQAEFDDRLSALGKRDFGLNGSVIRDIVQANRTGRYDYGDLIWRLFVLKHWMEPPIPAKAHHLEPIGIENQPPQQNLWAG
jgi:asparagine synthase (glutamine-hydrolysing)